MNAAGPLTRTLRRVAALGGAVLLGVGLTAAAAAPASATSVGYVRLAHLSPDTPEVDVYLSEAAEKSKPRVFEGVGYGTVSEYLPLPAGQYTVSMRKAGAPASQPPVLTLPVTVKAGAAYTVAGVGRYADLGLRVLNDDLSSPMKGQAKVRVVQASVRAPVLDVAAANGPIIAEGVQFATTTKYSDVEPGKWRLRLQSTGASPTTAEVTLKGGTVYSLLVLDAKKGGLTTDLKVDAGSGSTVPNGGVETGAGGLADPQGAPYSLMAAAAAALLLPVTAAAVIVRRRRARRTW